MPSGGLDLAPPPVRVWKAAAAAQLATLLAGTNLYSMGAGGFSTVPAMPQMVRIKQPARPGSEADIRAAQIYTTNRYPTKQSIYERFGRM